MRHAFLIIALSWLITGCLGTRLVELERVDVQLPERNPRAGWQAEVTSLLDVYEQSPVLAPADERLEPLFGGLATLSYFGADAQARVIDQQILPRGAAAGVRLVEACEASSERDASAADVFATTGLPAFRPVWLPLSAAGGALPEQALCSDHGAADSPGVFCSFGRLALQPGAAHPLVVVVHGLFDSGAQVYVQRMAAVLYRLGYSVYLPDLRDHGDTLRAAPELATTLGLLEGPDLLTLVAALRGTCGERIGRVGLAGVSGGGLAAIRALALDVAGTVDAGVLALSPLLDVAAAIDDLDDTADCPVSRSIELSWIDDAVIAAAGGVTFFAGAALGQALGGRSLDGSTALAGGIGAGAGLLAALGLDLAFDGGSDPCVSEHAIARMVQDIVRVRWRALSDPSLGETMSPAGRRLAQDAVTLQAYVRERAGYLARRSELQLPSYAPDALARQLRAAWRLQRPVPPRLLVIGADDDPMTRRRALHALAAQLDGLPGVAVHAVSRGGHGAMSMVQPVVMERVLERFFAADSH